MNIDKKCLMVIVFLTLHFTFFLKCNFCDELVISGIHRVHFCKQFEDMAVYVRLFL